jgi:hypothetical protein
MKDIETLQILIYHKISEDETISKVNLNVQNLTMVILRMRAKGDTANITFVESARQAFGWYSNNLGKSFQNTTPSH